MPKNLPKFNQESYIHYITTKTFKNYPFFKNEKCCLILLENLDFYREKLGFKILGYMIMSDHFHYLIFWDAEKKSSQSGSDGFIPSLRCGIKRDIEN